MRLNKSRSIQNPETAGSESRRSLDQIQPDEGSRQDASERHHSSEIAVEEEVTMKKVTYYRRPTSGSRFWNWTRKVRKRATPLRRMRVEAEIVEAEEPTEQMVLIGKEPFAEWNYLFLSDANASSHMLAG